MGAFLRSVRLFYRVQQYRSSRVRYAPALPAERSGTTICNTWWLLARVHMLRHGGARGAFAFLTPCPMRSPSRRLSADELLCEMACPHWRKF